MGTRKGHENEHAHRPADSSRTVSNSGKAGARKSLISLASFLIGFVISSLLSVFFHPFFEEVAELRDHLFCPNVLWCSSHMEFKSTVDAQCSLGSVGTLISQAIDDRNLSREEISKMSKLSPVSLATRTFLCDDVSWRQNGAISHLEELDRDYGDCFVYQRNDPSKSGGGSDSIFKVNTGKESKACLSNIWKNPMTGLLAITDRVNQAFVFCIPNREATYRTFSDEAQLPICSMQDLRAIGVPDSLILD